MILYDFRCTNGHEFEEYVESSVTQSRCRCGADAKRLVSGGNFELDPISGDFPSATKKWADKHEQAAKTSD